VASGTLGSGVTVALKADGTVEAVAETTITEGAGTAGLVEAGSNRNASIAYDPDNSKVVVAYSYDYGGSGKAGKCVVGTVSGSTISWGTPVIFHNDNAANIFCVYDQNNNKVVIGFQDLSSAAFGYGTTIVGTVSGTSISFGTKIVFRSASTSQLSGCYDEASGNVVISYMSGASPYYSFVLVGSVSGSSISFGTTVQLTTWNTGAAVGLVYDQNAAKTLFTTKNSSGGGYAVVGTVTGTSISLGTGVTFSASTDSNYFEAAYDANSQKNLIVYPSYISSVRSAHSIVATITGTSVTLGSETALLSSSANLSGYIRPAYDPLAKKITSFMTKTTGGSLAVVSTISGTSVSNASSYDLTVPGTIQSQAGIWPVYDANANKTVIVYTTSTNTVGLYYAVWTTGYTASNNTDFIGITDQAIADTATGAVIVQGGVSEKVTGLTTGSDYYVQDDGTLSTTVSSVPAGRALSSTSILLEG
jgi:hypothetical protein